MLRNCFLLILPVRHTFAFEFLACMEVDNEWQRNILCKDNSLFYLQGFINAQNCRISALKNPFMHAPVPFYSANVTVWCELTALFILWPMDPVICIVIGKCYENLSRCQITLALRQRACLDKTLFVQHSTLPDIKKPMMQLRKKHFENIISIIRHFLTVWPLSSPDTNHYDFCLWGFLKNVCSVSRLQIQQNWGQESHNTFTTWPLKSSDLLWNMQLIGFNV